MRLSFYVIMRMVRCMNKNNGDNFCSLEKYKLYRSVYEIFHPTISKKNISNYKVVLDEKMLPVHVFYPKKVADTKSVIIYIPGNGIVSGSYGKYSNICKNIALECNKLVIAIDYFNGSDKYPTTSNKIFKIINYLLDEFENNGVEYNNITLMGDSTGCLIIKDILVKLNNKEKRIGKSIFMYPVVRENYDDYVWNESCINLNYNFDKRLCNYLNKYYSKGNGCDWNRELFYKTIDSCLIILGDMDLLKEDGILLSDMLNCSFESIKFATHGFLNCFDEEILNETYKIIKKYLG